ncbi:hypothetical protein BKA57DRAFT_90883 [Linnemannia elongata]|nr:hypothetical protein BKA57DRAFT_90883 [Linnemannia elongata]
MLSCNSSFRSGYAHTLFSCPESRKKKNGVVHKNSCSPHIDPHARHFKTNPFLFNLLLFASCFLTFTEMITTELSNLSKKYTPICLFFCIFARFNVLLSTFFSSSSCVFSSYWYVLSTQKNRCVHTPLPLLEQFVHLTPTLFSIE